MGTRQLELLRRWTLRPDPDDAGLGERWWEHPPQDGWVSCRADEPWQKVLGGPFDGVAWYRRRVRLPKKWLTGGRDARPTEDEKNGGRRIRLWFGAVATDCRVWVNGVEVGTHIGDALPFEFDITEALGGNERCEIVCRVEQIRGHRPENPSPESSTHEPWGGPADRDLHDALGLGRGGIWGGVRVRVAGPNDIGSAEEADGRVGGLLLLRTPGQAVGLAADELVRAEVGVVNFGERPFEGLVRLRSWLETEAAEIELPTTQVQVQVEPGGVASAPIELAPSAGTHPVMLRVRAEVVGGARGAAAGEAGIGPSEWRLWVFPKCHATPEGVFRDSCSPFTEAERESWLEEHHARSGFLPGYSLRKPRLPDLDALLCATPRWRDDESVPRVDHLTIVTTRLTEHMLLHLEHGGRVVLLASQAAGSPPSEWVNLYGVEPRVVEGGGASEGGSGGVSGGVLGAGERGWVLATLGVDLTCRSPRAVPTGALGCAAAVEPIVRLVRTHKERVPEVFDQVFVARVGAGLLAVSTLDHETPAGRYLLHRVIESVHQSEAPSHLGGQLAIETVRAWCCSG